MTDHPLQDILSARLAETVFEPLPEIARRARKWGLTVEESDGQLTFRTPERDFVSGFTETIDPINRAVVLAWALAGDVWPHAFPSLLKRVNQLWTQHRKATR